MVELDVVFTSTAGNVCEMRRLIWQLFFFFCFDALQGCNMCNLKHYNLSSNLSTRQLWCMSWITGNISSVWSRFILRKCHFKEPPCRISATGDVGKGGRGDLENLGFTYSIPQSQGSLQRHAKDTMRFFDKPRLKLFVWCCSVEGQNVDKHSDLLEMLRYPGQPCSWCHWVWI